MFAERLQPDVRARIIGCKAQMEQFDFVFGLHLGERLYSHTDNLSKTLQATKMADVSGQRLANLTKETLTKMRNDQNFDHFYVSRKSEGLIWRTNASKKATYSGQTGGWCWCTKLSPNHQRSLQKGLL